MSYRKNECCKSDRDRDDDDEDKFSLVGSEAILVEENDDETIVKLRLSREPGNSLEILEDGLFLGEFDRLRKYSTSGAVVTSESPRMAFVFPDSTTTITISRMREYAYIRELFLMRESGKVLPLVLKWNVGVTINGIPGPQTFTLDPANVVKLYQIKNQEWALAINEDSLPADMITAYKWAASLEEPDPALPGIQSARTYAMQVYDQLQNAEWIVGEAQRWADIAGASAGTGFPTRVAFRDSLTAFNPLISDGQMVTAGGVQYERLAGSTAIADIPGWKPAGDVSPEHFGNNLTPGSTNMTAAINAAANYLNTLGGGVMKLTKDVKIDEQIRLRSNTSINLNGHTMDASEVDSTSTIRPRAITASGTYGNILPMAANSAKMSSMVTANDHGLVAGDMVVVGSNMLFDPDNTQTRISEMAFVKSVAGNTVTLLSALAFAYAVVNGGYIQKVTPVENIHLYNGKIIGPKKNTEGKAFHTLKVVGGNDVSVMGVSFSGASHADISMVDVAAGRVIGNHFEGSDEDAQLAYAVSFANNSCDCLAMGNTFNMRRHCISTNNEGASDWGLIRGIVTRVKFEGNVVRRSANYIDGDFLGDPLDTHGGAANIEITNNTVYHANGAGINVECMSATVRGNIIYISEGIGIRAHNETSFSGPLVIDDNQIHQALSNKQGIVIEEGYRSTSTAGFTTISCNGNKIYGGGLGIGISVERHRPILTVNNNLIEGVTSDGIAIVSQGQTTVVGNNVTAGGEAIQINSADGVTITGNACRTLGITSRGIMVLGGRNAVILGNLVTMPDGSTSDGIFVGALGGVPHTGVAIHANVLFALGVNSGIGINVLGNGIPGKCSGNVCTNFATSESLGTGITTESSSGGDEVNGYWVRNPDGTQECWITRTIPTTTVAFGTVFRDTASFGAWTFPMPFFASPHVQASSYGSQNWCSVTARSTTGITGVTIFAPAASTGDRTIVVRAVGRWKA